MAPNRDNRRRQGQAQSGPRDNNAPRGRGRGKPRKDQDGDISMGAYTAPTRAGRGGVKKSGPRNDKARGPRNDKRSSINTEQLARHITSDKPARKFTNAPAHTTAPRKNTKKCDVINVTGWYNAPKLPSHIDSITSITKFMEKKAEHSTKKNPRIVSHERISEELLQINVDPIHTAFFLDQDGYEYCGSTLKVSLERKANELSEYAQTLKRILDDLLNRKYDATNGTLDLSCLSEDPLFAAGPDSPLSPEQARDMLSSPKFFSALCEQATKTPEGKRRSAVQIRNMFVNISLAKNGLTTLETVSELSRFFPQVQALDLSGNQIASVDELLIWRRKLKALKLLLVANNPFTMNPASQAWQEDLVKWFPALVTLDDVQVRSEKEAAASSTLLSVDYRINGPHDSDTSGKVAAFVKDLVTGFDTDRHALIAAYYDDQSTFSLSDTIKKDDTDPYVRKSRNLKKVTTPPTRIDRLYTGQQSIYNVWSTLPTTKHPDLAQEPEQWCVESQMTPALNMYNRGPIGENGWSINIHGIFAEFDAQGKQTAYRSFDRNVVIGVGQGPNNQRVVSDILTVRDQSDPTAWVPTAVAPPPRAPALPHGHPEPAQPIKSQQELLQEFIVYTGLTPHYAQLCLEAVNYVPKEAEIAFHENKAKLPREAWA